MDAFEIRPARAEEAPAISALVLTVFEACVAPHYGAEGRATFGHEAAPEAIASRLAQPRKDGHRALVACAAEDGRPIGYLEVEKSHIRELSPRHRPRPAGPRLRRPRARGGHGERRTVLGRGLHPPRLRAGRPLDDHQRPHLPAPGAARRPGRATMSAAMKSGGAHETRLRAQLRAWLEADPWRLACLEAVAALDLFDGWIGAGFVRSLVWDRLHGFPDPTPLADVDVLIFEPGSGRDRESEVAAALAGRLPEVPWSVKNQARMHVRNGDTPYCDTEDALRHWLETPTAVAARLTAGGKVEILAPCGLIDLFAPAVRPTPHARSRRDRLKAYRLRMAEKAWPATWPSVRVYAS
jgi:hypothetical protein